MTYQLDGEHQCRHENAGDQRHPFHRWTEEMQQVLRAGMLEPLRVVVQKRANGTAQRHDGYARRRLEAGNQPYQITNQDEDKYDREKSNIGFAVMADNLAALVEHESLKAFKCMLQPAGRVHRQPRPQHQEKYQQKEEYDQLHRK